MKGYQKAQIEVRAAKIPLSRASGELRNADQRLKEKALFIIVTFVTAISLVGFGAFYFQPWDFTQAKGIAEAAPQEALQVQPASVELQKTEPILQPADVAIPSPPIQISREDKIPQLETASQRETALAEQQKLSLQNEMVSPRIDDVARTSPKIAEKQFEVTSSTTRPDDAISADAVAAALSQIKVVSTAVEEAESCVSKVRLLAKETVVYFPPSGVAVAPQYQEPLKRLAEAAKDCPQVKFDVAGHTDNTGELITNLQLSWQRAEATINFLKLQRFETSQFLPVGFSNARPAAQDATGLGQAKNRRVEFVIR